MKKKIKDFLIKLGYYSKPDFIIIGAQKAGTTGLFDTLVKHSLIKGSKVKEIHYFDNDLWYFENKLTSYHSFFPLPYSVSKKTKLFEATPMYLFHPEVAQRLHKYNPKLKLIIQLRNPATRAFSAWTMYHHHFKTGKSKNLHDPRTFTQAINDELKNIEQTTSYDNRMSYVKRGIYHNQIEAFLKYFPMNQLLFVESNNLKKQEQKSLAEIQDFIGVPYEKLEFTQSNKSEVSEIDFYEKDILELQKLYSSYNKKLYNIIGQEFKWDEETIVNKNKLH